MKGLTKEFVVIWAGLIAGFLVLENYTGFSKDIGALSTGGVGLTKALQGR